MIDGPACQAADERRHWCVSVILFALGLVGCSAAPATEGTGDGNPGMDAGMASEGSTALSSAAFCKAAAEWECGLIAPCCAALGQAIDSDQCVALFSSSSSMVCDPQKSSGSEYDPVAAEACVARLRATPAKDCAKQPTGLGIDRDTQRICLSVAKPKALPGAPCGTYLSCMPQPESVVFCENNVCRALPSLGEGASCNDASTGRCGDGLYCEAAEGCKRLRATGEPCSGESQCEPQFCVNQVCSEVPVAGLCALALGQN
jgi:hypothetical protein